MEKPSAPLKKRMPRVKVLSIADALCQIFETSFGEKAHILNMVKKVRKKKGENLAVSNNSHNFAYHLTT